MKKVRLHKQSVSRRPPTTFLVDSSSAGGCIDDNEISLYEMGQAIGLLTAPIDIENLGYKIAGKAWCTTAMSGSMSGPAVGLSGKTDISYAKIYFTANYNLLNSDPDAATFITLLYFGATYKYTGYNGSIALYMYNWNNTNCYIDLTTNSFQYTSSSNSVYVGAVFYA